MASLARGRFGIPLTDKIIFEFTMRDTNKISFRLAVIFVCVITGLLTAFGVFSYISSKNTMEQQLTEQSKRIVSRLQINLPSLLWNFDTKQLDIALNAEMNDPAISGILIKKTNKEFAYGRNRDETGKIIAGKPQNAPEDEVVSGEMNFDDSGQIKPVGSIDIIMSRTHITHALRNEIIQIIIQVVVLNTALIIALLLSLNSVVLNSLNRIRTALETIATGEADLTQRLDVIRLDEIGEIARLFNVFIERLEKIIQQVRAGTGTIASASAGIATGNHELSDRTEQQAASLEETASAMEQLTSTVNQNSDNARQANQMAASASEVAIKGGIVVAQVVDTMTVINNSSRKIVDIISVIDSIAFQTNILALNAAVEAARAGEQGRGFAVVAAEVRNLAQRSANAAKEIKELINDSVEKVNIGGKLVAQAGSTMNDVVAAVRRVTDIVSEISAASGEQSKGIEEIGSAIAALDHATQQNAALVEQATVATQSMHDQAQQLEQAVGVFKLNTVPLNNLVLLT